MQRELSHADFTLAWVNSLRDIFRISLGNEQNLLGKEQNSICFLYNREQVAQKKTKKPNAYFYECKPHKYNQIEVYENLKEGTPKHEDSKNL